MVFTFPILGTQAPVPDPIPARPRGIRLASATRPVAARPRAMRTAIVLSPAPQFDPGQKPSGPWELYTTGPRHHGDHGSFTQREPENMLGLAGFKNPVFLTQRSQYMEFCLSKGVDDR